MTVWERRLWLALWPISVATVAVVDLGFWINDTPPRETYALDLTISTVTIASGLILWRNRPRNRIGPLLVLAGFLWAIPGIRGYQEPVTWGIGEFLEIGYGLVLGHVLFAYPTGRLPSRFSRTVVALGYSIWLLSLVRVVTLDLGGCPCPERNALAIWDEPRLSGALYDAQNPLIFAYALIGVATIVTRWFRAAPAARRVYAPVLAAGLLFAGVWVLNGAVQTLTGTEPAWVFFPPLVVAIILPLSFLVGLLRSTLDRSAAGDLVVEVSAGPAPRTIQQALARALHDPSIQLAYWLPEQNGFVDTAGRDVELAAEDGPRAATIAERDGQCLAAIIHDRALLEDPRLVETVSATTGLLLENERLQAELRAQLAALSASRERIVRSGDEERRRLERDLHDGAQQRLLGLGMGLQLIRARVEEGSEAAALVDELEAELGHALQELRELARGIHPAVLTEQGLPAAVRALAERVPFPVRIVVPTGPLPASVETAAYFVVAESLANVAKYAHATQVWVTIASDNGSARVEVRDDGVGGARPSDGSGLQGLADRVGALGGQLWVASPLGGGTCVTAELPCA
jgi:signal transduction histidine kinase